jgi:hypothetical protein
VSQELSCHLVSHHTNVAARQEQREALDLVGQSRSDPKLMKMSPGGVSSENRSIDPSSGMPAGG